MTDRNTDQRRKWPSDLAALDRPPKEPIPHAERSQVMWSWVAVIAMVFVLGVTFYAIDTRLDERHARQVPATASSLASDSTRSTTSQAPVDQTTGQGASRDGDGAGR
jgi:hypothetical protein